MKSFYTLIIILLISGCNSNDSAQPIKVSLNDRVKINNDVINAIDSDKKILYFGFDLRTTLQEDARQYIPFLKYLESATGYTFKLHFTSKNSSIIDDLGNNRVQFAAMGAMSYLKAKIRFNVTPIAQGINLQGKTKYRSFLVTKPDSPLQTIMDIKGKRLAFGDKSSTQGHLIPRILLYQNGIQLTDLADYTYTDSHQDCAESVISGTFDICGMQDVLAESLTKKGLLRIIHRSPYFPASGIVANTLVPTDVIERVTLALLDFQPQNRDKAFLYHWDKTEMPLGFISIFEDSYTELEHWATKLGFIRVQSQQDD